jgi:hypothetical protein
MSAKGNLLFAKYAYSPNKLGYCGPARSGAIFDYCVANQSDQNLIKLLKSFEGAYPYLKLIAHANNIDDPFDERVVEAYWIGNDLLYNVPNLDFYNSLRNRFSKKIKKKSMKWILTKPTFGAKPNHSFHVLDIYTKTGIIRSGVKIGILETINNCLIMWGKVKKVKNGKLKTENLIVEYNPIEINNGKLIFTNPKIKTVLSPFINPKIGDTISFHWNNACEILTMHQMENLKKWTLYHLAIANKTM